MKKPILIISLLILFAGSLYVAHKISDQRGFERGAANKAQAVEQSYKMGFKASEDSIEPLVSHAYQEGLRQGKIEKGLEIAACTLRDAHAGKCHIECDNNFDCVAKNGRPETPY